MQTLGVVLLCINAKKKKNETSLQVPSIYTYVYMEKKGENRAKKFCYVSSSPQQGLKRWSPSKRGFWGRGMNFPRKASGQLTNPIPMLTSHSSQLSFTVEANLLRNSTITTWSTTVPTIMPTKSLFFRSPLNMFTFSGFLAFTSLNTWHKTKALNITVLLTSLASFPFSLSNSLPLNCSVRSTVTW